jgi:catechol 2,3-dioxygenase-like lactoylglutathione lyase family enzyme
LTPESPQLARPLLTTYAGSRGSLPLYGMSVPSGVEIVDVELLVPTSVHGEVDHFYIERLGLGTASGDNAPGGYAVGPARLQFKEPADGSAPFYHFAFLAPGNRFAEAKRWLSGAGSLLTGSNGQTTFEFEAWDAKASYVLDPAGNILEIIAHRGVANSDATGAFDAGELRGLSELGLVTVAPPEAVDALQQAGLPLWSGTADAGRIAFCGAKSQTLIVCSPGRGWLPTDRPAEVHSVQAQIRGRDDQIRHITLTPDGEVVVV